MKEVSATSTKEVHEQAFDFNNKKGKYISFYFTLTD